jgi:hypothetical protein
MNANCSYYMQSRMRLALLDYSCNKCHGYALEGKANLSKSGLTIGHHLLNSESRLEISKIRLLVSWAYFRLELRIPIKIRMISAISYLRYAQSPTSQGLVHFANLWNFGVVCTSKSDRLQTLGEE